MSRKQATNQRLQAMRSRVEAPDFATLPRWELEERREGLKYNLARCRYEPMRRELESLIEKINDIIGHEEETKPQSGSVPRFRR